MNRKDAEAQRNSNKLQYFINGIAGRVLKKGKWYKIRLTCPRPARLVAG